MHCPGGNATDPIRRVLASSDGISSWTPLKPQHSNPNPGQSTLVYWLLYSSHTSYHPSQTPLPSWNLLWHSKTDAQFMQDGRKAVWSIPYVSVAFFPSLKQYFIAYRFSKIFTRPDCIFEIHQLWQSVFSRVYSNCRCSYLFEPEIIEIGQSSHKMYSNNILNFQESTTILNVCTKKVWKHWMLHVIVFIKISFLGNIVFLECFGWLGCVNGMSTCLGLSYAWTL